MNILDYNSELDKHANIRTHIITKHDDQLLQGESNLNLKIIHLNIRSLNKNFDELAVLLESLKCNFDLIILSENKKYKYFRNKRL